jgi:hypothetical protein
MRALSVLSPWIDLIAMRAKTLEVRSWRTHHRGPLLLCKGTRKNAEAMALVDLGVLPAARGTAVCLGDVVGVRLARAEDYAAAWTIPKPGAFVWELANARPVESFAVSGRLSFFEVADNLVRVLPWRAPAARPRLVNPWEDGHS